MMISSISSNPRMQSSKLRMILLWSALVLSQGFMQTQPTTTTTNSRILHSSFSILSTSSLSSKSRTTRKINIHFPLAATAANATTVGAAAAAAPTLSGHLNDDNSGGGNNNNWYPTRIQETLPYRDIVQRLYLRHIVTETKGMADWALSQVQLNYKNAHDVEENQKNHENNFDQHEDPFARLAKSISVCAYTREDGGKIGWVEDKQEDYFQILPAEVITKLYNNHPKPGDIVVLPSTSTGQWHIIQVAEAWMQPPFSETDDDGDDKDGSIKSDNDGSIKSKNHREYQTDLVGAHKGSNTIVRRPKLKGAGVLPTLPANMKTYSIQTAGCQMNVADSERLEGVLQHQLNLSPATKPSQADLIVLNTCSIRDHAEQKLYDALGPFAAQKRKGKDLALIVTGCVAQQEGQALLRRVPEIDVVLGPQYVPYLTNVLGRVKDGHQVVATAPMLIQEDYNQPIRGHDVRAWVNIIYGCNEHCTYCVVPSSRGMEQSRTMKAILHECLELADQGYKEVTLIGQNIDAYGRDSIPKQSFANLLEYLDARLPSPMRIRYVTSHPRYFSDRVIDAVANLEKVCECFHVPFQAGDDKVLREMRRGYSYNSYMRIINKIRKQAPDAAICGDVIVGFPGETDEEFKKTLQLMEEVHFDNLNTFSYSPRPNTEAALWENQIPEEVKAVRLQQVQDLAAKHGLERSQRYLGRVVEVLVEDPNPRNPAQVMGRTRQGRQVYFDGDLTKLKGEFVDVKVTEARTWSLVGEIVTE